MGAGFAISMRDLEIRGAGNLLGTQQSGHIATIGYELVLPAARNRGPATETHAGQTLDSRRGRFAGRGVPAGRLCQRPSAKD